MLAFFFFLFLLFSRCLDTLFQCGFLTVIAVIFFFFNSSWSWFFKTASNCSVFSFSFLFFFFTNTHVRKVARLVFWCVRTSAVQQQNKRAAREKRKGKEHRLFSSATRRRKEVERRRIKCLLTLFVQHQAHPNSIDLQELVLQPQFRVVASASLRKQDYLKKKKYLRASPSFGLLIFFFFCIPVLHLLLFTLFIIVICVVVVLFFFSSHVLAICNMAHKV